MSFSVWPFRRTKVRPLPQPWTRTPPVQPKTEQRTYLADAPYLLPKDAQEDQRLNFQRAPREV